jgi:hypothetical protein
MQADDMSMQMVQPEKTFYARVKDHCHRMINIMTYRNVNSTFVTSIYKFYDEFDTHHDTREQFIGQCAILQNARLAYKANELSEDQERGREYPRGNVQIVTVPEILEELCVCIETYLEQKLFTVWHFTDKGKEAPEFPTARQGMKNLTSFLMSHAQGNQEVISNIVHLQENFEYIISRIKWCHDKPGVQLPADGSHHQPIEEAHIDLLLKSLAQL